VNRRNLLILSTAAITWPLAARAQQKAMPVIGYLEPNSPSGPGASFLAAFRQGLTEAGYVEGQNLAIEYRWAESHSDRLSALAADLVRRKVDIIVASGSQAVRAAQRATQSTPIVMTGIAILSALALSPAWRGQAATSPALACNRRKLAESGWNSSSRLFPDCPEWLCC
jgi:ABC-type uncharacterized transport system substrate-binding protein